MRWIGIEMRRPGFWEFTSASVMAVGLWVLLAGIASRVSPQMTSADFASLLVVMWLAVIGALMGLDPRKSRAAAGLQLAVCSLAAVVVHAVV